MPPFAPRKFKTPQQRTAERAAEKKAVKKYMVGFDPFSGGSVSNIRKSDPFNEFWADYFLRRREECGETSIQVQYSLRVFERLGVVIEEDVTE